MASMYLYLDVGLACGRRGWRLLGVRCGVHRNDHGILQVTVRANIWGSDGVTARNDDDQDDRWLETPPSARLASSPTCVN